MTEKELKKLSRADLLELLLQERRENEQLHTEINRLKEKLADRTIKIQNAGSIAVASLQLSGIFNAAQEAADRYLESIRSLSEKQNKIYEQIQAEKSKEASPTRHRKSTEDIVELTGLREAASSAPTRKDKDEA